MFSQNLVYTLGILNLILAGIAIFCVVHAEDHPEHFSLVYIAVSIFMFYMGTILIIIILQIIETCREQHKRNQSSLEIQMPTLTTEISPQLNSIIDETITKPKLYLSHSQTLPLVLSSYNPHHTSSLIFKNFKNTSNEFITTSTYSTFLPNYQETLATLNKNYQSFAFITNDHRHSS
ncbi:unnamed protein product [Rotaria sp. Silwood2]|nr:unnamed protein product [Rotaria sp. Silwood2]CAF3157587.1 unnamed protein product [Rotaria sp. Silwood2]CAF3307769.1 unnamed protein product [Rotaria sp. Silwood2]CAF3339808.1 unnamed protein product [Rotaria sp. Silwood2]CAF4021789.1 unnamed protein product [Rotaria sp. Silwood2]